MTYDQAMAFMDVVLGSKPVRYHLEAVLGRDEAPRASDFDSRDGKVLDRVDQFLRHNEEVVGIIRATLKDRPKQTEIKFPEKRKASKPEETPKVWDAKRGIYVDAPKTETKPPAPAKKKPAKKASPKKKAKSKAARIPGWSKT